MRQLRFDTQVSEFVCELNRLESAVSGKAPKDDQHLRDLAVAIRKQSDCCLEFEAGLDPSAVKRYQANFQKQIEPWFQQSWFMHRAKTKPRGYPGDYATLNGIYENRPMGDGFGGYLDLYFLKSDLARAVRGRMEGARSFLSEFISNHQADEPVEILNVASGPGREYFVGLEYSVDTAVRITCIDSDSEALDHVKTRSRCVSMRPDLRFANYNALRMRSSKKNVEQFGTPHLIYSVGLFDYLPDDHLIAILKGLRETVRPGGVVYVAFKDQLRYNKAEYQWFVDWFFYQRTEQDCRRLLIQAGFADDDIEVNRDATGIIINFMAAVPVSETIRLDPAQNFALGLPMKFTDSEQVAD